MSQTTTAAKPKPNYIIPGLHKPEGPSALAGTERLLRPPYPQPIPATGFPSRTVHLPISLLPPPNNPKTKPTTPNPRQRTPSPPASKPDRQNVVIVLIPTANAKKAGVIREKFQDKATIPAHITAVHFITVEAESNVGEQPYDDAAGVTGAINRVVNAAVKGLKKVPVPVANGGNGNGGGDGNGGNGGNGKTEEKPEPGVGEVEALLKRLNLKQGDKVTIMVGAVENYIKREKWKAADPTHQKLLDVVVPVDYGVVAFCRVGLGENRPWTWKMAVSEGVTVPVAYWIAAQRWGFDDPQTRTHGKVTVGDVLAANVPGLDKADWHKVVTKERKSRYDILGDAMKTIAVPWPSA